MTYYRHESDMDKQMIMMPQKLNDMIMISRHILMINKYDGANLMFLERMRVSLFICDITV